MLGAELCDYTLNNTEFEVYGTGFRNSNSSLEKNFITLDLTDQERTYSVISRINPDIIIHTAANSSVDICHSGPETAYRVNVLGTRNLCVACQRFDTVLCYLSTDYVFSGKNTPAGGYTEFDTTGPVNVYGKTKLEGELCVKSLLNKYFIARTCWLFGKWRKTNFVSSALDAIKNQSEIKVITNQVASPTYTRDLAESLIQLVQTQRYGTYHITNGTDATRDEVVQEIFKLTKKKTKIKYLKKEELYKGARPDDSRLNNYVWQLENFEPLRSWRAALKDFVLKDS